MAKPYKDLRAKMPADARKRAEARANVLMQEMPLYELRQARQLSQVQLARELHVGQANVSKIERRADVYISTLRSYVEAMGGELEITARFPQGMVKINQFETIEEKPAPPRRRRLRKA
jgi:transcriptional regulator with XRE-family HTH domain